MKTDLQIRARAANLPQRTIAAILHRSPNTVWRALAAQAPDPAAVAPYAAIIAAWEIMTPEQRQAWIEATTQTSVDAVPPDGTTRIPRAALGDTSQWYGSKGQ